MLLRSSSFRIESQCQFVSSAVHSIHLMLTIYGILFEFYFHLFKVQNYWPLSAVVAKRETVVAKWMTMHLRQISKILKSSLYDWLIVYLSSDVVYW